MASSSFYHFRRLLILYLITFTFIVPILCYFLPYSKLFKVFHSEKEMLINAKDLNKERLADANAYFNSIDKTESRQFYNQHNQERLDLLVVIVTVQRKSADLQKLGYFLQATAAMDKLLKHNQSFRKKKLVICNVDAKPINHTDVTFLSTFIPTIQRYGPSGRDLSRSTTPLRAALYDKHLHRNRYEKETVDYMFCLESAYHMNSSYILMMEDDAIPHREVLSNVKHVMDTKLHHNSREFGYIKLYYPQKWQGFAFEETRIIELLSIGCMGAGIFVFFLICLLDDRKKSSPFSIQILYFLAGCIYFILIAELLDRQNIMELRRFSPSLYSFKKSPGCCTQAMLYSDHILPSLVNFLQDYARPGMDHTDIAIYKFTLKHNIPCYQIEPNLFHHVGLYTSLVEGRYKDPEGFLFHV
ncbi:transmembrane protein 246-like [Mizuhopecten yessoensis]|uniref:Transmembrane protein 246 n=1 Tax=Mizuhopecten yessoensis TaxID=6573 RepID=A0A210QX15_MIZYE|nr:transmembrane protein 246-like [Mizuhopecten yessoensis]OWF53287.1 Transmembrane protein 246 [Mizuhopecten yessoensis]